jgi:hypothetical protein
VKTGFWQPDPLRTLARQADQVELKLVVPTHDGRSLGLDRATAPARLVYFLDTPDLDLYRHGVIIRFRDRKNSRDDATVKLRPVLPGRVPRWLRQADRFQMEIDALPGHAVCSGALKERLGRGAVAKAIAAGRPMTKLLSPGQRKLLAQYAPSIGLGDLVVFGPINVRCQSVKLRGLDHGVRAERWHYPDGSYLLELSARCPVDEAAAVARRVSTALRAYGVVPADEQRLKTDMALQAA